MLSIVSEQYAASFKIKPQHCYCLMVNISSLSKMTDVFLFHFIYF